MALEPEDEEIEDSLMVDIIESYDKELAKLYYELENDGPKEDVLDQIHSLYRERRKRLEEAGYITYVVNSTNYEKIGKELECDLGEIGIDKEPGDFLLILDRGGQKSTTGSSYTYTYNGKKYTLRSITMTYNDENAVGWNKVNHTDIFNTTSKNIIQNALKTAISYTVSAVSKRIGVLYDMLTIALNEVPDYGGSTTNSDLVLYGTASWTRFYTQVKSPTYGTWSFGSCVERTYITQTVAGNIWNNKKKKFVFVVKDDYSFGKTEYSSHYSSTSWKRNTAVQNYLYSSPCSLDQVGNISFYHGNTLKFTLREPAMYP